MALRMWTVVMFKLPGPSALFAKSKQGQRKQQELIQPAIPANFFALYSKPREESNPI